MRMRIGAYSCIVVCSLLSIASTRLISVTTTILSDVGQAGEAGRLLAQADALRAKGTKASLEASLDGYHRAEAAARSTASDGLEARALLGQGIALTWLCRSAEASPILARARAALQKANDRSVEAEALTFYGIAERLLGNNTRAVSALKDAIQLSRGANDRRVEGLALNGLGWAAEEPGVLTAEDKRSALEAAVVIQRGLPNRHDLSMSLSGLGLVMQKLDGPKAAIRLYEEAYAVAEEGHSPRAMGQALSLLGYAFGDLGELDRALTSYNDSLPLLREAGHRIQEPYTLQGIALILLNRGRVREALGHYQEALAIRQELKDRRAEGFSWHSVGVALATLGDRARALECYERALEIHRANRDRLEEATTLLGLASLRINDGDPRGALGFAEAALNIYRDAKDQLRQGWGLRAVGMSMMTLGRYKEAIVAYREALDLAVKTGRLGEEVTSARWLGRLYAMLGDAPLALKHLERAVEIAQQQKLKGDVAVALAQMAGIHLEHAQADAARALLERALPLAQETEFPTAEARVLDTFADLELHVGRPHDALKYLDQSLAARRREATERDQPFVFVKLGRTHQAIGDRTRALGWFQRALASSQSASMPAAEAVALVELMRFWADNGERRVAAFYGKQAVNRFQQVRADLRSLDDGVQRAYVGARAQVYRELADILIADGRLPEAQQVVDLLKEQEFFDFIRRDGQQSTVRKAELTPTEAATEARYRESAARVAALGRERGELLAIRSKKPEEDRRLTQIERDLASANEAFTRWLDEAATEMKSTAGGADPTYQLREAQGLMEDLRELGDGVVALYTLVGTERYRIVLITPDARVAAEYPIRAEDLNRRVMAFRQSLENPRVDPRPLAQELYQILLGPIAPALARAKAHTLMWSLDGTLRYLSVAALHDGKQYLAEQYRSVIFTPASHTRLKDAPTPHWTGLGVGVSRASADFSALPAVPEELHSIFRVRPGSRSGIMNGRVLLDEAFTADAFRTNLRQRRPLVHVASHFRFRPGNETDSYLLLGDGSRMTLAEVRNAPNLFAGVELLSLSACNTAVGDNGATGAEVEGFAVMAQRQGAKAVMASLWSVADAGTRMFMEAFYRARLQRGTNKADALREAQLVMLRGGRRSEAGTPNRGLKNKATGATTTFVPPANAPYAHPYYWAPFVLVGNWK